MKFCDKKIQECLLNGGKIKRKLEIYEVVIGFDKSGFIFDSDGDVYQFGKSDIAANDWEIVEPEYDWNRIIKDKILCVFSDDEDRGTYVISPLIKVEGKGFSFMTIEELSYSHCKPFNPADFNIAKDLKEYEK